MNRRYIYAVLPYNLRNLEQSKYARIVVPVIISELRSSVKINTCHALLRENLGSKGIIK
jgi:hypothetical protein